MTVFLSSNPDYANKHNDVYWDDARLLVVARPLPTPLPRPTATIHPVLSGLARGVGQGPGQQGEQAQQIGPLAGNSPDAGLDTGFIIAVSLIVASGIYYNYNRRK